MKTGEFWKTGLGIAIVVLFTLILCSSLRLLNVILYRVGGIGVLVAILALAYGIIRKRN